MNLPIKQTLRGIATDPAAGAVVLGLSVGIVGAVLGLFLAALAGLTISAVGELFLEKRQPLVARALRTASLGLTTRMTLRLLAVTAVAGQNLGDGALREVALLAGLILLARAGSVVTLSRLRQRRRPAVETRGVPLSGLRIPPPPPNALTSGSGALVCLSELFLIIPASDVAGLGSLLLPLGISGTLLAALLAVYYEWQARRVGTELSFSAMQPVLQQFLDDHRPRVILYSGDGPAATYQVNMWLQTLELLDEQGLVLLRNRRTLQRLARTSTPVFCVSSAEDLMALDFGTARVSLFVANVGNNIHLLRVPGLKSAFIGHGDSDKNASFNPYSRVYDEVWVAGPAGRDRYEAADIGVRPESIVEVGRPQVADLAKPPSRPVSHVPTLLYAPTWEGWNESQAYSSVATHGVRLARAALVPGSGVRFIYKPHPFTGRRDPAVRLAHAEIVRLVEEANAANGTVSDVTVQVDILNPLTGVRDPAVRSQLSGQLDHLTSASEVAAVRADAESAIWHSVPPQGHHVIQAAGPSLNSCFQQADVLVTDVSSVLTDFQATGRPIAVCNTMGLEREDFASSFPSVVAATVIDPEDEFDEVLDLTRGRSPDLLAPAREAARARLLGSHPGSLQPFQTAVTRLAQQADTRLARLAEALPQSIPARAAATVGADTEKAAEPMPSGLDTPPASN